MTDDPDHSIGQPIYQRSADSAVYPLTECTGHPRLRTPKTQAYSPEARGIADLVSEADIAARAHAKGDNQKVVARLIPVPAIDEDSFVGLRTPEGCCCN